jgi:hypothetical protein
MHGMVAIADRAQTIPFTPAPRARGQRGRSGWSQNFCGNPSGKRPFERPSASQRSRLGSCSRDPIGYEDGENLYRAYFVPNSVDPEGTHTWADCFARHDMCRDRCRRQQDGCLGGAYGWRDRYVCNFIANLCKRRCDIELTGCLLTSETTVSVVIVTVVVTVIVLEPTPCGELIAVTYLVTIYIDQETGEEIGRSEPIRSRR